MANKEKIFLKTILNELELWAPIYLQEEYDNSGLQIGNPMAELTGIIISLDCTEEVILEAKKKKCNLIITHHPLLFKGLKKITDRHYTEKLTTLLIKNEIALISMHTNLDNVVHGVNKKFADLLELQNTQILDAKEANLYKLISYVPPQHFSKVLNALFEAGAGNIGNYSECSFSSEGLGTFKPIKNAQPFSGKMNERSEDKEIKFEVLLELHQISSCLKALNNAHPYETVAYELVSLANKNSEIGSGMIGELEKAMNGQDFLNFVAKKMQLSLIKYSKITRKKIKKVAICGGAGAFLIPMAIAQNADVFISSDLKYHDYFEANNEISVMDIGHYESECHTSVLIYDYLSKKFPKFAVHLSKANTNPVNYFLCPK